MTKKKKNNKRDKKNKKISLSKNNLGRPNGTFSDFEEGFSDIISNLTPQEATDLLDKKQCDNLTTDISKLINDNYTPHEINDMYNTRIEVIYDSDDDRHDGKHSHHDGKHSHHDGKHSHHDGNTENKCKHIAEFYTSVANFISSISKSIPENITFENISSSPYYSSLLKKPYTDKKTQSPNLNTIITKLNDLFTDSDVKTDMLSEIADINTKNNNKLYNNVETIIEPLSKVLVPSDNINNKLTIHPNLHRESLNKIITGTTNNIIKTFLKEEKQQDKIMMIEKIIDNLLELRTLKDIKINLINKRHQILSE
jgi:hypothetical protein